MGIISPLKYNGLMVGSIRLVLFNVHVNKYLFPCNKSLLTEMYIDVSFSNKVQRQFKTVQHTLTGNVTCHCFGFWLLPVLFCILMCLPVFVSFLRAPVFHLLITPVYLSLCFPLSLSLFILFLYSFYVLSVYVILLSALWHCKDGRYLNKVIIIYYFQQLIL